MVRRTDASLSLDVLGTAFDVLPETDFLAVAGRNALTVVTIGTSTSSSTSSWVQLRHNRNLVRLLKFNPIGTGCFCTVSGSFVDVYTLGRGSSIQRLASFQAQSRKVSDFCWCPFDEHLMMSCAEGDSVSFWDLRSNLYKPSAQLGLLFGASQAKFAPHLNNLVLSSTGNELRLWDLRYTSQPIVHFKAHQSRVLCLDWHPNHQEPNSFFTSANDGALKLWSFGEQRQQPSILNVAPIGSWRLVFSQEGQELAALSLSPPHSVALFFNYGLENIRQLKEIERDDTLMDAAWHKSTSALKSTTKFLYTLSKKNRLCRHAIAYELSNEIRDEMSTPIMQSAVDEERDRLIAATACVIDERTIPKAEQDRSRKQSELPMPIRSFPRRSFGNGQSSGNAPPGQLPFETANLKSLIVSPKVEDGKGTVATDGGHKTPQSPIYSDWHRWVKAPNVLGGDLLTELEALRKHSTEGLYTTEVNFQRAAIGFSYMHKNRFRKICWEMRFHREFIENGLVFVEVIQNESPLTPENANLFLTLLQQECDEQLCVPSVQTVLCRVFHQLPKLIELLKLFPLSSELPSAAIVSFSKASSQSDSAGDETELIAANQQQSSANCELGFPSKKQSLVSSVAGPVLLPVLFTPSPFDHRVPAPRNCGARFNSSSYLVTFGRGKNSTTIAKMMSQPQQQVRTVDSGATSCRLPQLAPSFGQLNIRKTSAVITKVNVSVGDDESVKKVGVHPRSLAEYCVLVNSPLPTTPMIHRQCSSMAASTSAIPFTHSQFQCSPPVRCLSPLRPASPWARPSGIGTTACHAEEFVNNSDKGAEDREPNSLSPPSQLKQQNVLFSGLGGILGSSPNSASLTAINPRTFSLHYHHQQSHQSPAFQAIMRQRVTTMTAVAEGALAPANTHPPPLHYQMSAMAELSGASKSITGWPAAAMPEQSFTSTVFVYDAVSLLPISKKLARSYKLLGNSPAAICRYNYEQAVRKGRRDLLAVWRLLEHCVSNATDLPEKSKGPSRDVFARVFRLRSVVAAPALVSSAKRADVPWSIHPFGRRLINRLLEHYISRHDLQTAAVITCLLDGVNSNGRKERRISESKKVQLTLGGEQQHITAADSSPIGPTNGTQTEQTGGLFFAMDQTDSGGRVPPAPPVPLLLPSQQFHLLSSRKTSAVQGSVCTSLASVIPSLSFVSGGWSRQSSESNAATVSTTPYSARTMSEALYTSATSERLSPAPDIVMPYQRSATMEAPTTNTTFFTAIPSEHRRGNESTAQQNGENELLLDPSLCPRFEQLRHRYADILYRWRMYRKCAEVLKHCSREDESSVGTIIAIYWCSRCGQQQPAGSECTKCHRIPMYCSICEQPCRGVVATCSVCSHGGHFAHLTAWFNAQSQCPLGCGCECRL